MSTFERTFNGGEVIIREGDSGNTFFQLLEGRVGVFKNYDKADEVQVAVIEPGQYFGEMAIIEARPAARRSLRKKSYMCLKSRKMN